MNAFTIKANIARYFVLPVLLASGASTASAENYLGLSLGGAFASTGTDIIAMEDLNYTGGTANLHPATGSDIEFENSLSYGVKFGRYMEFAPGWGWEIESQYSRPDFKRQNVTVGLTDGTTIGGYSSFTEDQLPADIHMLMGGLNILYRFNDFKTIKPYIGGGPAVFGVLIRGSGDSCHIVDPAPLAQDFCEGGEMISKGMGIGFNAKTGFEIPITERLSFDTEYKFSYGKMNVDDFRSFSDIDMTYMTHNVSAGLRLKF